MNHLTEANGPNSEKVQRLCHDTLPWLSSLSLGEH